MNLVEAVQQEAEIDGVSSFEGFDPHDENEWPSDRGVYVCYDISEQPILIPAKAPTLGGRYTRTTVR